MSVFQGTKTPGVRYKETSTGRTYYVDYKDSTGKRQQHSVQGDYDAAKAFLAGTTTSRARGEAIPTRIEATYADYSNECIDRREKIGSLKPQSAAAYRSSNKLYVLPLIGSMKMTKITKHDILRVVEAMRGQNLAAWTINGAVTVMSMTFSEANWAYGIPNHVRSLKPEHRPQKKANRRMHVLDPAEIEGLFAEAQKAWPHKATRNVALLMLAIYSGLRQSELLGLWWGDLDLVGDEPSVHVHAQLGRNGERLPYLKSKEKGESRTVEIPRFVAKALLELKLQSSHSGPGDYVFTARNGEPMSQNAARVVFVKCRDDAGIQADIPKEERCHFHDMRDTFVSLLIAGGANIVEVQHAVGHEKASTTLDNYAYLWNAQERRGKLRDILEASAI